MIIQNLILESQKLCGSQEIDVASDTAYATKNFGLMLKMEKLMKLYIGSNVYSNISI